MFKHFLAVGFLGLFTVACGSQSSETPSAADAESPLYAANSATSVGILMTDKPPTLSSLSAVNVSISKVEVHVLAVSDANATLNPNAWDDRGTDDPNAAADDKGGTSGGRHGFTDPNDTSIDDDAFWQTILMANTNFNLLALQGNVTAVVGGLDLAAGVLTQVRLFIDPNGLNNVVLADNTVCPLDVSSVINRGLRINESFPHTLLDNGNSTVITVDFDAANALSEDGPCAFSLRPVFRLHHHAVGERHDGGWAAEHGGRIGDDSHHAGDANANVSATGTTSIWNGNMGSTISGGSSGSMGGAGVRGSGTISLGDSNSTDGSRSSGSGRGRLVVPAKLQP